MEETIYEIINSYGYIGLCLLMLFENIFPILPGFVVIFLCGYLSTFTKINVLGISLYSTIGSLIGAFILYYIGRFLNKEKLKKIFNNKYLKILKINSSDIEKCDKWFDNKGNISVFYARFIPVFRSFISIPAGISEMSIFKFLLYTFLGNFLCNCFYAFLGYYFSDKKEYIINIINNFSFVFTIIIILIIIYYIYKFYKNKRS